MRVKIETKLRMTGKHIIGVFCNHEEITRTTVILESFGHHNKKICNIQI